MVQTQNPRIMKNTVEKSKITGIALLILVFSIGFTEVAFADGTFVVTGDKTNGLVVMPESISCDIPGTWRVHNQTNTLITIIQIQGPGSLPITSPLLPGFVGINPLLPTTHEGVYIIQIDPPGIIINVTLNVTAPTCGKNNQKVQICHKGKKQLCIASEAANDHLDHGDFFGPCGSAKMSATETTVVAVEGMDLLEVYPNPFSDHATIKFSVPESDEVTLEIYNTAGVRIATLYDGMAMAEEIYTVNFDATHLSGGIYFYRFSTKSGSYYQKGKIVVIK